MPFESFITENENIIRLGVFIGMLLIIGLWELIAPRRVSTVSKLLRWGNNLSLVIINSIILRLIIPIAAAAMASFSQSHNWGLFNNIELNPVLEIILVIIILDFIIYWQHVLVHAVPVLWRIHRVHHADLDYDVTTGSRFHPIEIILSMLIKLAVIAALGPAVVAVILFEGLLNGMAMFNHGNIGLPARLEKFLRVFIVTPDMHRVHHSIEENESNQNFGFNLSCWDRLFGTYTAQPEKGHINMQIGIRHMSSIKQATWLSGILMIPFMGKLGSDTIIKRNIDSGDIDSGNINSGNQK